MGIKPPGKELLRCFPLTAGCRYEKGLRGRAISEGAFVLL